jgi:hypothetical protein
LVVYEGRQALGHHQVVLDDQNARRFFKAAWLLVRRRRVLSKVHIAKTVVYRAVPGCSGRFPGARLIAMTRSTYLGAAPIWVFFIAAVLLAAIVLRAQPVQAPVILTTQPSRITTQVNPTLPASAANLDTGSSSLPYHAIRASGPVTPPKATQPAVPHAPSNTCSTNGPGPTMHPMCMVGGQVRIGG